MGKCYRDKSSCRLLEQRTTTREDDDVGDFVPDYVCDSRGILKQFSPLAQIFRKDPPTCNELEYSTL